MSSRPGIQIKTVVSLIAGLSLRNGNDFTCSKQDKCYISCPNVHVDPCISPSYGKMTASFQWEKSQGGIQQWTMHGLWPGPCRGDMSQVLGCDPTRAIGSVGDLLKRSPGLEAELDYHMPPRFGSKYGFWANEWLKHGTCISTLNPRCSPNSQPGDDVIHYFKSTVQLSSSYNFYDILQRGNIVPGRVYNTQLFLNHLNQLGIYPELFCVYGEISEIRLVFHAKGTGKLLLKPSPYSGNCPLSFVYPLKLAQIPRQTFNVNQFPYGGYSPLYRPGPSFSPPPMVMYPQPAIVGRPPSRSPTRSF